MKLITKEDVSPGQIYPDDAVISYGSKTEGGWFFRIELPFKYTVKNYYDINNNTKSDRVCRKVFCLIHRNKYNFTKLYSTDYPIREKRNGSN